MQKEHLALFEPICLRCKENTGAENRLILQIAKGQGQYVEEGQLYCPSCQMVYPIIHGIPILVPNPESYIQQSILHITQDIAVSPFTDQWLSQSSGPNSNYDLTKNYISTYMWSHYDDLNPNRDDVDSNFSTIINELLNPCLYNGPLLDIGCAVGRGTFALAKEGNTPTLGIDINFSMLRMAHQIKKTKTISYQKRRCGTIYETVSYPIPLTHANNVDFWAVDACHLPFPSDHIIRCHSSNLIDCVRDPAQHLQELSRVHSHLGYISIVTPFDWSPNATEYANWIGGHSPMFPLKGDPVELLKWYFSSESPFQDLQNFEIIRAQDNIPWRIRIHDRSTMHYNLHLISVRRNHGLSNPC